MTLYNAARKYGWTFLPVPVDFFYETPERTGRLVHSVDVDAVVVEMSNSTFDKITERLIEIMGEEEFYALEEAGTEYDYILCYHLFGDRMFDEITEDPFTEEEGFYGAI